MNEVLMKMLPTIRPITWLGRTRTGKSKPSCLEFGQSKLQITQDECVEELIPSIVTAKHLDFCNAEPLTKYKLSGKLVYYISFTFIFLDFLRVVPVDLLVMLYRKNMLQYGPGIPQHTQNNEQDVRYAKNPTANSWR